MSHPLLSDEILGTFVPVLLYWLYSVLYVMLGSSMDKYKLHTRKEEEKNLVSRKEVVRGVLVQQMFQVVASLLLFKIVGEDETAKTISPPSLFAIGTQFLAAMVVLDTWQYFVHRFAHINRFLYRHVHSKHHLLVAPYPYGALYNHPLEGLLLDTLGGALSFLASGMSPRTAIFFFSFATLKTVDDHCGMWIPWHPLHLLFSNNSAYHDVHHQLYGGKYNFSQPFFVAWDRIMGTRMPYSLERRKGGGFEVKPVKKE